MVEVVGVTAPAEEGEEAGWAVQWNSERVWYRWTGYILELSTDRHNGSSTIL